MLGVWKIAPFLNDCTEHVDNTFLLLLDLSYIPLRKTEITIDFYTVYPPSPPCKREYDELTSILDDILVSGA